MSADFDPSCRLLLHSTAHCTASHSFYRSTQRRNRPTAITCDHCGQWQSDGAKPYSSRAAMGLDDQLLLRSSRFSPRDHSHADHGSTGDLLNKRCTVATADDQGVIEQLMRQSSWMAIRIERTSSSTTLFLQGHLARSRFWCRAAKRASCFSTSKPMQMRWSEIY